MNRVTVILFHGVFFVFVHELALIIAAQQIENYIVPRTTLELSSNTNKSTGAEGHKRICNTDLDCEAYTNNKCCRTISGFSKCRSKCRTGTKVRPGKRGRSRRKNKRRGKHNKERKVVYLKPVGGNKLGCEVSANKVYKEGEVVQKDGCNDCKCTKGKLSCTKRRCVPGKCAYKNKLYDEGYRLVLHNGCKKCVCQNSAWDCASHPCEEVVKQPQSSSTMLILPSVVLPLLCSAMHHLLL